MRKTALAAYEGYGALGRCPECRGSLVRTSEEDGAELACSLCGIVTGSANTMAEDGSFAPPVSKRESLGSYIVTDAYGGPTLTGATFGLGRVKPNIIGRVTPLLACTYLTQRVAQRLRLPKGITKNADIMARRLLPHRKAYRATLAGVSAYSLLHACRSAGIVHVSHREILKAYTDAGYRVDKAQFLHIGLESGVQLPHPTAEDLVKSAVGRMQSSEKVAARLRNANLDPKAYFAKLVESARELAETTEPSGFSPRTVAAGSVYRATQSISPRTVTQREVAETLGMAEYTIRDFCVRTKNHALGR